MQQSTTHTVTTTTYHESRTVSSSSGGCCSPPFFDPQYYRGLPAILKLLEVILSLIAYLCVQCPTFYCPVALQTTRPYFLFISFFAFASAAILWGLLLFRVPFRILRCKCVNWPFIEMVFYVVVIILFVFGDIFISLYSTQCPTINMDPYKAGAAFGWFALGAFIVDLIFLIRLFRVSRNPPPYSVGGDSATAAPADANPKY